MHLIKNTLKYNVSKINITMDPMCDNSTSLLHDIACLRLGGIKHCSKNLFDKTMFLSLELFICLLPILPPHLWDRFLILTFYFIIYGLNGHHAYNHLKQSYLIALTNLEIYNDIIDLEEESESDESTTEDVATADDDVESTTEDESDDVEDVSAADDAVEDVADDDDEAEKETVDKKND
jgi:hypothetical protein